MTALKLLAATIVLFVFYLVWQAAFPQPRGPDGRVVLPLLQIPDEYAPTRPKRHPRISLESLENDDENQNLIVNWDSVLTLAKLSDAVYSNDRRGFAVDKMGFDRAETIDQGNSQSMVCSNEKVVVVAFRGTETSRDRFPDSSLDVIADLSVLPIEIGAAFQGCKIHSGFYLACDLVYNPLIREIKRQGVRNKRLIVTGHSLGGAMAIVFAYRAKTEDEFDPQSIVTFGQPLIANEKLASKLVAMFGGRHLRLVHRDDLVTRVARPYFHSGSRILLIENKKPLFWAPQVLTQAAPGNLNTGPSYSSDPLLMPFSESEMAQIKKYAKSPRLPDDEVSPRGKRREAANDSPAPNTAEAEWMSPEWFKRAIDDHKMKHYVECIEEIEVDDPIGQGGPVEK